MSILEKLLVKVGLWEGEELPVDTSPDATRGVPDGIDATCGFTEDELASSPEVELDE